MFPFNTKKLRQLEQDNALLKEQLDKLTAKPTEEPWVEIKSQGLSPTKGMCVTLDWNDAFIKYLEEKGLTAADEETLVQKWLTLLYKDLLDRMEDDAIDGPPQTFE